MENSAKSHVEVSDKPSGNRDTGKEPATVFERLHRSSWSKQAPDNQEQKKINASDFDAKMKIIKEYLKEQKNRK